MNTYFQRCTMFVIFTLILTLLIPVTYGEAELSQTEPVKLKVLLLPYLSFAPFFIAEEEGFFAEQGLEIEFVKMSRSADALPALIKGDLDVIAAIFGTNLLNAISRGGTVKIVADKGRIASVNGCPANAFLARKALIEAGELKEPSQLRGRRISVNPINTGGYYLEKVLKTAQMSLDDVKPGIVSFPVMSKALKTGAVDLLQAGEPWITRLIRSADATLWLPFKDILPGFQFAVILYGPTLLTENPTAGQRFMVAYLKAVQQYNQGKTEQNLAILGKYTGLDRALLQETCWAEIQYDGAINLMSIDDFQTWAIEKKLLDRSVTEDEYFDHRFIDYANQVLESPSK